MALLSAWDHSRVFMTVHGVICGQVKSCKRFGVEAWRPAAEWLQCCACSSACAFRLPGSRMECRVRDGKMFVTIQDPGASSSEFGSKVQFLGIVCILLVSSCPLLLHRR